jgi:hypothetical protein
MSYPASSGRPDRNRVNAMMIQELEAQLAENTTLLRSLEEENAALRRKERLLQVMSTQSVPWIHLMHCAVPHHVAVQIKTA